MKNLIEKIASKIYIIGKKRYDREYIKSLFKKGLIDSTVQFSSYAQIQNLSENRNSIRIGANSNIEGLIMVYPYGGEIEIGQYCSLSQHSRIISNQRILIGNRVLIAHNVNIIDNNSHPLDAKARHKDFIESYEIGMQKHDLNESSIIIGDDVWIGHNSTVFKGVTIGEGAIIGSCSVVTKDVQAWTVNVGNPLRIIRYLPKT
jgi:acetyltransferase-like isoleucine patch superfamily enzyme